MPEPSTTEPLCIVLIEDEPAIRRFLRAGLGSEAEWHEAETGAEGLRLVARHPPDVVLLDLGLPDQEGLEVLRKLREWTQVPVIVLSARGQEHDKVLALDGGADDYLTKPFAIGELMARIRVARRHAQRVPGRSIGRYAADGLTLNIPAHRVLRAGEEIRLTALEFRLLAELARHAGLVVTASHLLREVWGPGYEESTHTLRVHMANLRGKIERDPAKPVLLRTEIGVGYRLMIEPDETVPVSETIPA